MFRALYNEVDCSQYACMRMPPTDIVFMDVNRVMLLCIGNENFPGSHDGAPDRMETRRLCFVT